MYHEKDKFSPYEFKGILSLRQLYEVYCLTV